MIWVTTTRRRAQAGRRHRQPQERTRLNESIASVRGFLRSFSSASGGSGVDCRRGTGEVVAVDDSPSARVSRINPHLLAVPCGIEDGLLLSGIGAPSPVALSRQKEWLVANRGDDACAGAGGAAEVNIELSMWPARAVEGEAGVGFGSLHEPQWPRARFAAASEFKGGPMAACKRDLLRRCRSRCSC